VPAFVVFNAAPHSATTLLEDARAIVEDSGLMSAPTVLRERSAYRAAWPLGETVVETQPKGKAAQEISVLTKWVLAQLQVCTPSKSSKTQDRFQWANRRSILTAVRNEKPKSSAPAAPSSDPAPEIAPKTGEATKPSRRNKLHIGGYFDPDDLNVIAFQKLKVR
jgi:hypothetical protein